MGGFIKRNLQNFANIACNFSLAENVRTAAQGDLSTKPEMCFAAFLLLYRDQVAKAVAGRHPDFAPVAALVISNTQAYKDLVAALDEEFSAAAQFYQNPAIHSDPDYLVWMLTVALCRYPNDEITPTLKDNILAELDELDDMMGFANILFSAALWYADYEGYRDLVMATFPAKKAEFEAAEAKKKAEEERIANEAANKEKQRQTWRAQGVCQYCGGTFTGLIGKKCSKCGKKKDY